MADLDTDEGEIIVSNRRHDSNKVSPSPSPVKYDLEPNKFTKFDYEMLSQSKNSNYDTSNSRQSKHSVLKHPDELVKLDYLLAKQKQDSSKSKTKYNSKYAVRKGGKEFYVRAGTHLNNLPVLKKGSREKREIITTTIGSNSVNTQDPTLSKSVESNKNERIVMQNFETERMKNQMQPNFNEFHSFTNSNHTYTNQIERDIRNQIQRKPRMKMPTQKRPESKDKNVRDSPYVSNYPSKISKRKSKEERGSKESLGKVSKKKDLRFKRNSKRSKNDIFGCDSGKNSKTSQLKNSTNTMSKKIKVKSVSQNQRKKPKKSNFNNTFKESDLIESIIKFSNPVKNSQTKLNQTMALYSKNKQYPVSKYSNRDYFNQVNNNNQRATK